MPHARYPLTADGLVVPVVVGPSGRDVAARAAAGQPPIRPVQVQALIDSASDLTCLDPQIIRRLGLTQSTTRSTQSFSGSASVGIYEASLSIRHPAGGFVLVLSQLLVMDMPQQLPFDALLGLDVLRQLHLLLDGPAGDFTLGD
jgi:hypothetical protein